MPTHGVLARVLGAVVASTAAVRATASATSTPSPSWARFGPGLNEDVYATTALADGTVVAGGMFTAARYAGAPPLHYVAAWNNSAGVWVGLGSGRGFAPTGPGVSWFVRALAGAPPPAAGRFQLIVGGDFDAAFGGAPRTLNYVAAYDDGRDTWVSLGRGGAPGFDAPVYALAWVGTTLYAGGSFTATSDGAVALRGVAAYDASGAPGAEWRSLGGGLGGTVFALAASADGGSIFAGGSFAPAGGAPVGVARWDGGAAEWRTLGAGSGLNGAVFALVAVSHGGTELLIAGGAFTAEAASGPAGVAATLAHVAVWNASGSRWGALGRGLDDAVLALTAGANASIYAGGVFAAEVARPVASHTTARTAAGARGAPTRRLQTNQHHGVGAVQQLNNVARWSWDGAGQWAPLGGAEPGLNSPVFSLAVVPAAATLSGGGAPAGTLVAGGDFDAAFGGVANTLNNVGGIPA